MLDPNKLVKSAEACLGWPYVSPGTNDSRGIDCSGLFVKCFRDQGASIYHGSNTIYRKYCSEKGLIKNNTKLLPGMAVFKWNPNTPAKFDDDLGDFQHIGMVTSINPLRIVHASTGPMCVTTDTNIGKWKYWGRLKNVAYDESGGGEEEKKDMPERIAIITAKSGSTVNLRKQATTKSERLYQIPLGEAVSVLEQSSGWTKVFYKGMTGYVMNEFLSFENTIGEANQTDDPENSEQYAPPDQVVKIYRARLEALYDEIGDMLGLRG